MRFLHLPLWCCLLLMLVDRSALAQDPQPSGRWADFVNPLIGTDSEYKLSNGNTYPAIATPWGMNFWTPQTGKMGDGWGYTYDGYKIRGFKQTHQPSPWINDYAAFALLPQTGKVKIGQDERASWFSHKTEVSRPHYYKVYLSDYDVTTEIAPTDRAAHFRFTFPQSEQSHVLVDGFFQGSMVQVLPGQRKVIGYCRNNSGGVPANFHNYFVIEFDKEFEVVTGWSASKQGIEQQQGSLKQEGEHVGTLLTFKTRKGEQVHARVASSFISPEQAQRNLDREIGADTFEQTKTKAFDRWNAELSRIDVSGGTTDQYRVFYTAMYRLLLFPRMFYEYDAQGQVVHYSPYNGKVLPGYMFTDNGFWDTFRAVFPFYTLMYPEQLSHIMEGLVNTYKESGWLPEWASPGHRDCMVGSNSAVNIADAYLRGIRGYDIETLYEAIVKNSENEGPLSSVGRKGVKHYNQLGYIPYNVGVNENVARTMEYAFADWCIAQLGKSLGKPEQEVRKFEQRAFNYRHVFDAQIGFVRGKNLDGSWSTTYSPDKWGDALTEGSAWHWTWCVFHDPAGLAKEFGGVGKMRQRLDEVFEAAPTFDYSYYGQQIHEITEMAVAGMGQYAHGNQPIQHAPYLYNWTDQPWKAQQRVRQIMDTMYTPLPDGLCGDEDNGQTSAWYVFSALGFYPVAPGTGEYAIGSPLFKQAKVRMGSGKLLDIKAPDNSEENVYVQSVRRNGKSYAKTFFTYDDLQQGGRLQFNLDKAPNQSWGQQAQDKPYSLSREVGQ